MDCKHKWVNMEDGTLDKFCVRCREFAMQEVAVTATIPVSVSAALPVMRETMEVPLYTGSEHIRVTVDKENFLRELNKDLYKGMGVSGHALNNSFSSASG